MDGQIDRNTLSGSEERAGGSPDGVVKIACIR